MQRDASADAAAADTLRGTIAVVGSEPATWVVLRPITGGAEIMLRGDPVRDLRRLSGVEVRVEGRAAEQGAGAGGEDRSGAAPGGRTGMAPGAGARSFTVERFEVRAVDGVPAVDGVLAVEDDVVYLRLSDGELRRVANPPAALRDRIGAWVWLAGPLDGRIEAFGVIRG
jgi:hypothetical protein